MLLAKLAFKKAAEYFENVLQLRSNAPAKKLHIK